MKEADVSCPARTLSLAYLTVARLTPPEHVLLAKNTGFDAVGLRLAPALADEPAFPMMPGSPMLKETLALLADTDISVLDVEIIKLDRAQKAKAYIPFFEAAAMLGARNVLVTSDVDDVQVNSERLAALCTLGARYGLRFHVEFMPWARGVRTIEQAERLVQESGAVNAHIMVDAIHFDRTDARLSSLMTLPRERFQYMQLCDAPRQRPSTHEGILEQGRYERLFPGEGGLALAQLMAALPENIPISVEVPKRGLREQIGVTALAASGNSAVRRFLREAGRKAPAVLG